MKKVVSFILCISLLFSCVGFSVYAQDENKGTNYPYVFVHGMMGWGSYDGLNELSPYWGGFNGDMLEQLREEGIECYAASVGKISSVWDRACELYAQLTGTRVDYGKAHSEAHNHERFGRTYEGNALMNSFGKKDENGNIIKINLIGHSLGGPTVRLFTWLLANGSQEETEATGADTSDFFKGGKGDYVYSVTTMSAPHNGAPAANVLYDYLYFGYIASVFGSILGLKPISSFWDYQLEQFGISSVASQGISNTASFKKIKNFVQSDDNCGYDLTIRGAKALNDKIDIVDGIYYFSYTGQQVTETKNGNFVPPITMFPLFTVSSFLQGRMKDGQVYDGVALSKQWRENDGLVPVISALAPFDEPSIQYEESKNIEVQTGIWNVMPVIDNFSHVSYMGLDTDNFKFVYDEIISIINSL